MDFLPPFVANAMATLPDPIGFNAALLGIAAFVAGFIDAIAGGGGLITLPALALYGLDPASAIATNKIGSVFGSGSASLAFVRAGRLDLAKTWGYAAASGGGAIVGACLLRRIPVATARQFLPILLIGVALWFALAPKMGDKDARARMPPVLFSTTLVPAIGCYDGLFGPGTGSFFMAAFVFLRGFGLIKATGCSKLANFASNVAGLMTLLLVARPRLDLGLIMGLAQFFGARLGAQAVMAKGTSLVRPLLIGTCTVMALKLLLG